MPSLPYMTKHKGFPSCMPHTDFQFTIRRAAPKPTPIGKRERKFDRKAILHEADANFLACLYDYFGVEPFERGNLDAGRISSVFGKEVLPYSDPFDPAHYEAMLILNVPEIEKNYPEVFHR